MLYEQDFFTNLQISDNSEADTGFISNSVWLIFLSDKNILTWSSIVRVIKKILRGKFAAKVVQYTVI